MMPAVNRWHAAAAALLFFIPQTSPAAEDLTDAARELARKTAALVSPGVSVKIAYRNLSSLPDSELTAVRRQFEAAMGATTAENPAAIEARVSLSENTSQYLLVEETHKGEQQEVWIASWKRSPSSPVPISGVLLDKRLVWEQEEPILDISFSSPGMLVLSGTRLASYVRQGERWEMQQAVTLTPSRPWPRDLRGRLRATGNRIEAFLPGILCSGSPPGQFECRQSDEPWVLESGSRAILLANFLPGRNYFDGRLVLQDGTRKSIAPFYSAAAFGQPGNIAWVLALVDGRKQILDNSLEPISGVAPWGSDIVGTSAPCGGGSQILATRPTDSNEPDALEAFGVVNGAAVAASSPASFPGPITALWPAGPTSALAVARDLSTGKYAAYLVTVACGP